MTAVGAGVLWGHEPDYEPQQHSHVALIVDVGGVTLARPMSALADRR